MLEFSIKLGSLISISVVGMLITEDSLLMYSY